MNEKHTYAITLWAIIPSLDYSTVDYNYRTWKTRNIITLITSNNRRKLLRFHKALIKKYGETTEIKPPYDVIRFQWEVFNQSK